MNKDKAIQLLERLQDPEPYEPMLTNDAYDAIQMAIDALSANGDTISRKAAIEVIDSFNVFESRCDQIKLEQMIGELPPANNSEFPNSSDTISRQAAIEALKNDMASLDHIIKGMSANDVRLDAYVSQRNQVNYDIYTISNLPPVQPAQLGTNLAEVGTDCISREQAIEICNHAIDLLKGQFGAGALVAIKESIEELPPAQPERRCVNCGRTVNNGGWYEDGRTRCPIEEHYALPKDGYCHLWEKRKDWEDGYVKRAEEGEK